MTGTTIPRCSPPMENPSELWLKPDHKHDLAFRPLETSLLNGTVDAIYTQSKVFQHIQEATGTDQGHREPGQLSGLDPARRQRPGHLHLSPMWRAEEHPELVVTLLKGLIKVGRWANENKHAAAAILDKQTYYLDAEDTYQGIKDVDMVPSLSPYNLECPARSTRTLW